MIGNALSRPCNSASTGADASTGREHEPANAPLLSKGAPLVAGNSSDAAKPASATNVAVRRDATQQAKAAGQDPAARPTPFAALMQASTNAVSSAGVALAASPDAGTPVAADAAAPLPCQMLALLSCAWSIPQPGPGAASRVEGMESSASRASKMPTWFSTQVVPALSPTQTLAAPDAATAVTAGAMQSPSSLPSSAASPSLPAAPGMPGASEAAGRVLATDPATTGPLSGPSLPPGNSAPDNLATLASAAATSKTSALASAALSAALPTATTGVALPGELSANLSIDRAGGNAKADTVEGASAPDCSLLLSTSAPLLPSLRTAAAPPTMAIVLPPDLDAGFDDAITSRVAWMAGHGIDRADIRISPEHVGPIEVRLQLDGTRVSAEFHSGHAEVRQALEASLPRLREMLGQQGLQLDQANVGQRQPGHDRTTPGQSGEPDAAFSSDATVTPLASTTRLRLRGLLDEYA